MLCFAWIALHACSSPPSRDSAAGLADAAADDVAADTQSGDTAADLAKPATPLNAAEQSPAPVLIAPNEGPTSGMQLVTITGQFLGHVETVLFGDTPALQVDVQDDGELQVIAPPHPAGVVDITLRVAVPASGKPIEDGKVKNGYRYVGKVEVTAVSPKYGPAQGGTALTISGNGFTAQTQFVVGHRLALLPSVLDEHTATLITPPGQPGSATIAAANEDGTGQLANAFLYQQAPIIDSVSPAVLPFQPKGGAHVAIHGHALSGKLLKVQLTGPNGAVTADAISTDGETLLVALGPEGSSGLYDVTVQHADGWAKLPQALALVDMPPPGSPPQDALPPWALWTVTPAAQPVNQLQPVILGVSGHATAAEWQKAIVAFGMMPAQVLNVVVDADGAGATLQVQPPPTPEASLPQTVNVDVQVAGHVVEKTAGFHYLPASLAVVSVTPTQLAPAGGTAFKLTWTPHDPGQAAPVGVRVGALQASQIKVIASADGTGALTALAPPGAPGPADVTLQLADGTEATLWHGAQYLSAGHAVYAVLPAIGAQAGGTWVDVVGAGLDGLHAVLFNGAMATDLQVHDGGWASLRTPRGDPGPADVQAMWAPTERATLKNGFTYFDPRSGNGGTWGATIGASLNVTVVRKNDSTTPIPGALVIAQSGANTWHGFTDDRGQITFSGPGMAAPVDVHASKAGYTAGSLVALSAENATIRLSTTTPANGNGDQPVAPPNGTITGTVLDADKYTVLPSGNCVGQPAVGGNCKPCTGDSGCYLGATCEMLGPPDATTLTEGGYCAAPCTSYQDCPEGFTCSQFGAGSGARWGCRPQVGTPQVRCEPASGGIYGSGGVQEGGIVDVEGHFKLSVTPGATAVICRSGYVEKQTGTFIALAIGVTRNLFTNPGQLVTGVAVHVHVPLDREVRVHMIALPMGPDTDGGQRSVTAAIDLGADGYIPMGTTTTKQKTDTLLLTRQPSDALFTGDNADLRYEFYGGVTSPYGGPPMSSSGAPGRAAIGLEHAAVWHPGAPQPLLAKTAPGAFHAFAAAGNTFAAVGDKGHIASWTGGDFTVQASPTAKRLDAVWLANDDPATAGLHGWTGGQDGVLARRSPLGWLLWPQALAGRIVALQGRTANDVWALLENGALAHWTGDVAGKWQPVAGPPVAPGLNLTFHAVALLPAGALLVAGDAGQLWLGQPIVGTNNFVWLAQGSATSAPIRAALPAADGLTWLAGDRGYLAAFDGKTVTTLVAGTFKNLYGLYQDASGAIHVVGQTGAWLRVPPVGAIEDHSVADMPVDLRGVLPTFDGGLVAGGEPVVEMGPYLEIPYMQNPLVGAVLGQTLDWAVAPGHAPTLNMIRIADATYATKWEIFLHGNATHADLPDFPALAQFSPLPAGMLYLRHWRILAPQLDIDALNPKLMNQAYWLSWAYATQSVASPMGSKPAAFNPQLPPPDAPGPQPWPK